MKNKREITIIAFLGGLLLLVFLYLAIFSRALDQAENHIGIVLALPKVILTSEAVRVDDTTYLTKDIPSFVKTMQKEGFVYTEQLGSGLFFTKENQPYLSISKMYSSHFMVFTYPITES